MVLYHGSNVVVKKPEIRKNIRALDFGQGFYTTSDFEQARRWSKTVNKRNGTSMPIVSFYEFDDSAAASLKILRFETSNADWLSYISANRSLQPVNDEWDIVIGPVANDNTMPTIGLYLRGYITQNAAIEMLLPQKLKDQYVFKTEKSLNYLHFVEAKTYE